MVTGKRPLFWLFAILCALPLAAHHSMSAEYDDGRAVTLNGAVSRFAWANPHVWVFLDVPGAGVEGESTWEVELSSRLALESNGWTSESLHVGDLLTVEGAPARDGRQRVHGKILTISGGARLMDAPPPAPRTGSRGEQPARPTPRWPDGHPRLGPEPGGTGYWANASVGGMWDMPAGEIAMNGEGLLANIADADKVAPFLPWARGLYVYRQKNFLKDDPMAACLPPGGPRQFQAPYGIRFLEEPARKRILVMSQGGNRNWRLIPLDGRELPDPEEVTGSYFGYSTGRWEGDTLVVDSTGYVERFWFTNGGLPHTESLHLTERLSRPDFNTLKYEVTVDDPGAYTRPWSASWTLEWIARDEQDEYFCDDYNRELEHVN